MHNIKEILQGFIDLEEKEFHRFNSWRNCYNFFQKDYFNGSSDDDTAALHLGFYLASWGMYRGSTFLLQNDYLIHIGVVKILKKYSLKDVNDFKIISNIKNEIKEHYLKNAHVNKKGNSKSTDVLITKILLGTLGNTPAYDRYFLNGILIFNQSNPTLKIEKKFSTKSLSQLSEFYANNETEFNNFEEKFPMMKLIDMYFWKLGFDNE